MYKLLARMLKNASDTPTFWMQST